MFVYLPSILVSIGVIYFVHAVIKGGYLSRILAGGAMVLSGVFQVVFTDLVITWWAVGITTVALTFLTIYLIVACEVFRWAE